MSTPPLHLTTSTVPNSPIPPLLPFEESVESPAPKSPEAVVVGNVLAKRKIFEPSTKVESLQKRVTKRQRTQEDPTSPEKPSLTPEKVAKAAAKMKAEKQEERVQAYGQMREFVGQGKGDVEAIRVAKENALSDKRRVTGIRLFEQLFGQKKGFKEGVEVAGNLISSRDATKMKDGYRLLTSVAENGGSLLATSVTSVSSRVETVIQSQLNFLCTLVKNGYKYEVAIKEVQKQILHRNHDVQSNALKLYTELIKQGQKIEESERAIKNATSSLFVEVREQVYLLLSELVRNGQNLDEAKNALVEGVEKEERKEAIIALLSLFTELLKRTEMNEDLAVSLAEKAFKKRKEDSIQAPLIAFLMAYIAKGTIPGKVKEMVGGFGRLEYSCLEAFSQLEKAVGIKSSSATSLKGDAQAFEKWAGK